MTPSLSAAAHRAAAISTFPAARRQAQYPCRDRLAVFGVVRPYHQNRQARDRAGRRQHRDGLLPLLAPAWAARKSMWWCAPASREMKASPWEKEDAMHEGIPIHNFQVPVDIPAQERQADRHPLREGRSRIRRQGRRSLVPSGEPDVVMACDDVLVAVGQENAFPWIERDIGLNSTSGACRPSIRPRCNRPIRASFSAAMPLFGPKNIIWAVAHGHDAAISIDLFCQGKPVGHAPAAAGEPLQPEDGHP